MNQKSLFNFIKEKPLKPILLLCLLTFLLILPFIIPYNKSLVEGIQGVENQLIQPLRIVGMLFGGIGIIFNIIKLNIAKDNTERKKALNLVLVMTIFLVILFYIPFMLAA
jgi:amino acid permease